MRDKMSFENIASPTAYAASGSAVVFGLNAGEFAAYAGVVIAVATFALNWYYKAKATRERTHCPVKKCPVRDNCELSE